VPPADKRKNEASPDSTLSKGIRWALHVFRNHIWVRILAWATLLATLGSLIGIPLGIWAITDRFAYSVEVEPKPAVDASNSFTTPFYVRNDGNVPVYAISVECFFYRLELADSDSTFTNLYYPHPGGSDVLKPGSTHAVFCGGSRIDFGHPIEYAELRIIVKYRPAWRPAPTTDAFEFTTVRASNGELRWLPMTY
jgi:hypothetical protein